MAAIACAAALCLPSLAQAQTITIANGAQWSLGAGSLNADCADLLVAGTLSIDSGSANEIRDVTINPGVINGGSGTINLSGNWTNLGTFNAQSGAVQITDGCSTTVSQLVGDTTFNQFSASTNSGKELQPAAGSQQAFNAGLSLSGPASDPLLIRTSAAGSTAEFVLSPGAAQSISGVDVQDIDASAGDVIAPGPPARFDSVDSGNNTNWFISAIQEIVPVDTLPAPLLALLAALILLFGTRARLLTSDRLNRT